MQVISVHSSLHFQLKAGKRKVQGVPQSQTAALSRHQEEEENRQIQTSTNRINVRKALRLGPSLPQAKRTEKHKNKMTQGKTNRLVE